MTELKLGNDPAAVASSHEFDFHCDDETRLGNNPLQPAGRRPPSERTRCAWIAKRPAVSLPPVTNHVEPHKVDMMLFWNSEQWQPECKKHHGLVKQLLEVMFA